MAELRAARDKAEAARRDLAHQVREQANPNLLNLLPTGTPSLEHPEPLMRQLFDLTHLEIHYDAASQVRREREARHCRPIPAGNQPRHRSQADVSSEPTSHYGQVYAIGRERRTSPTGHDQGKCHDLLIEYRVILSE